MEGQLDVLVQEVKLLWEAVRKLQDRNIGIVNELKVMQSVDGKFGEGIQTLAEQIADVRHEIRVTNQLQGR